MSTLRQQILHSLKTNERAVQKALVRLYERQTQDEQASHTTQHVNGRGFNAADAGRLSPLAQAIINGQELSIHELREARERVMKYVGQLEELAIEKELAKWGNK